MDFQGHLPYIRQLQALIGVLVAGCLLYCSGSRGTFIADIPEIGIPIGITTILVLTSIWVHHQNFFSTQLCKIVRFGWVGALISALTSIWWVVFRRAPTVEVLSLSDEILTVWSLGIGAGILVGTYTAMEPDFTSITARKNLLAEVPWTGRSAPDPILEAVVEAIGEVEDTDPLELDPLWKHIDPDVFSGLASNRDTQWQLVFSGTGCEIIVSSHGVVAVYDADASAPKLEIQELINSRSR